MKLAAAFKTLLVLLLLTLVASGDAFAARKGKADKAEEKVAMFPDATRPEPKIKPVTSLAKQLQKVNDLSQEGKNEETLAEADKLLASKKIQPYEKSFALQAKGFAYIDLDADKDTGAYDRALPLFVQTLETDGLPNDMHYQIMYQVAQMYMADEKYDEALKWMDRFLAETKSTK